jgi:hypothetical protein
MDVWGGLAGGYDEHVPFASISGEILDRVLGAVRPRRDDGRWT